MKLPGSLFDDKNQARALFIKGVFVAVRSSSARAMTANHKLRSLSVTITERDIAQERGKKEEIDYERLRAGEGLDSWLAERSAGGGGNLISSRSCRKFLRRLSFKAFFIYAKNQFFRLLDYSF